MTETLVRRKFVMSRIIDGMNNNKFYDYLYDPTTSHLTTEWGRVGDSPQTKDWGTVSQARFDALCEKRVKDGYVEVKLATVEDDRPQQTVVSHDPDLRQVLEWIYSEANEYIQSYLAATVDALSLDQIQHGEVLLQSIARAVTFGSSKMELLAAIQDYYNTIPTQIPRRIDPDTLVNGFLGTPYASLSAQNPVTPGLDEQADRLEQLKAAVQTHRQQSKASATVSDQYSLLGATLTRVWPADPFYSVVLDRIESRLKQYRSGLRELYLVTIPAERQRYEAETRGKSNPMLLFHGTRGPNIRHILKSGLVLNRARSSGLYGPGLYHSPVADKSWAYTQSNRAPKMMFLDLVAAGQVYVCSPYPFKQAPEGYDSVRDHDDREVIVYHESQVTIKALAVLK